MRCLPDLTTCHDRPFWVTRQSFYQYFNQTDFCCRESAIITPAYLAGWFHTLKDGIPRFNLSAFMFVAGSTQFINGRHRTAVLLQECLDEIPVAVVLSDDDQKNAQELMLLDRWGLRPLGIHEFIELPDLPVVDTLP